MSPKTAQRGKRPPKLHNGENNNKTKNNKRNLKCTTTAPFFTGYRVCADLAKGASKGEIKIGGNADDNWIQYGNKETANSSASTWEPICHKWHKKKKNSVSLRIAFLHAFEQQT